MTDMPSSAPAPNRSAEEIWDEAADWLIDSRTSEGWGEQQHKSLQGWLAKSPANRVAFWRLEAAWDRTDRLAALRPSMRRVASTTATSKYYTLFKIAAAVVVLSAIASFGLFYLYKPVERTFATATGERQIIKLADGSSIELNTDTVLKIYNGRSSRTVALEKGEAFFQVKHDANHPFRVTVGSHVITDLGTIFEVRKGAADLKVSLLEGSARIETTPSMPKQSGATLNPGDVAIATADTLTVTKESLDKLANEFAWRRGLLIFNNTPLAEVVAELNRYNATKLVIADAQTARVEIGGTFPANNTEAFTRVAHELLGLNVERRGNQTVISRLP